MQSIPTVLADPSIREFHQPQYKAQTAPATRKRVFAISSLSWVGKTYIKNSIEADDCHNPKPTNPREKSRFETTKNGRETFFYLNFSLLFRVTGCPWIVMFDGLHTINSVI